jgi:hypothetical protein
LLAQSGVYARMWSMQQEGHEDGADLAEVGTGWTRPGPVAA